MFKGVGANNRADPKYAKSCCHKTTWAFILMTPIHLLEASGAPAFTLQQGGWVHFDCTEEAVLSRRGQSAVYITL